MGTAGLVTILFISIAIIITLVKIGWNAALALFLGSMFMGLAAGVDPMVVTNTIAGGFGAMMTGLGFSVAFGIIMGTILSGSGAAKSMAKKVLKVMGKEMACYAIMLTSLIIAIPIFFDVAFIIVIPLAIALGKEMNTPRAYPITAAMVGCGIGQVFIPPTPAPLGAAEILGVDTGLMIAVGAVVGVPTAFATLKISFKVLEKIWNQETDEQELTIPYSQEKTLPHSSLGFLIIGTPLFMILTGTAVKYLAQTEIPVVMMLTHKNTALATAAILGYILLKNQFNGRKELEECVTKGLYAAGTVLLITGAGGAFGAIIKETGIGELVVAGIEQSSHAVVIGLLVTGFTSTLFRVAQGSGTMATITSATIMAGANLPEAIGVHPVWVAIMACVGAMIGGHINDSGFWVVGQLSGFTMKGTFKTYSLIFSIIGAIGMLITLILAMIF